jgi:hypothetical protein
MLECSAVVRCLVVNVVECGDTAGELSWVYKVAAQGKRIKVCGELKAAEIRVSGNYSSVNCNINNIRGYRWRLESPDENPESGDDPDYFVITTQLTLPRLGRGRGVAPQA